MAVIQTLKDPIKTYATETQLLATSPADGFMGYAQDTDAFWFRRNGAWETMPNNTGGNVETHQNGTLAFPIDYSSGTDPVVGTIFTSQAEIDAYLLAHGQTHFKHIMACFDCLPDHVYSYVYFNLQSGVHRPRNPEPTGYPWAFARIPGRRYPNIHYGSYISINLPDNSNINYWEVLVGPLVPTGWVTNGTPAGYEYYMDFAGTPFTAGALKGYTIRIDYPGNPQYSTVRDNTASRLYLNAATVSPLGLNVHVVSPACILRNSYNDTTAALNKPLFYVNDERGPFPGASFYFGLDAIRLDQFALNQPILQGVGSVFYDWYRVLIDQARLKNQGIAQQSNLYNVQHGAIAQFWKSSVRGCKLATVPTNATGLGTISGEGICQSGRTFYFPNAYFGGCGTGLTIRSLDLYLSATCFDFFGATSLNLYNCGITSFNNVVKTLFKLVSGTCVYMAESCSMLNRNTGQSSFEGAFENCSLILQLGSNNLLPLLSNVVAGSVVTNCVNGIILDTGYNNRIIIGLNWNVDGTGNPGIFIPSLNGRLQYADLAKQRFAATQPSGTLAGAVIVQQVSDMTVVTTNDGSVQYTAAGTLLQYKGPADLAYGVAVNVGAGGIFILRSGTDTNKWIQVFVSAPLLPVLSTASLFKITERPYQDARGHFITKLST